MSTEGDQHQESRPVRESLEKPIEPTSSHAEGPAENINNALVAEAIEAIGFGKYQWQLTFTCGFGFLVDQMLLVSVSLVTPQAAMEFGPRYETLLSVGLNAGLLVGALSLGVAADNFGRRLVWQLSIFGVSVIVLVAASSPNWAALNVWVALSGYFAGGNLAIDLTILAESIPAKWSFILSGLAAIWGLGNAFTGLIGISLISFPVTLSAWPLLVNFGCAAGSTPETCPKKDNMGWRYLYITLGGICLVMSFIRAVVLKSRESPRWLVSCGRIAEAVDSLNKISSINGSDYTLTADHFIQVPQQDIQQTRSLRENVRRTSALFSSGPRLMACLAGLWILIGIAYPLYTVFLPFYLAANGVAIGESSTYITYRDWTVSSIVGIFGPLLSMYMVSTRWLRSRISMAITAAACVAFSGAFTTVKTMGQNLAFSSMINFSLNALYAVIYSYTPQALDVENRGVGVGLLMGLGRLSSLSAPFIATFADVTSSAPIWVSCGCYAVIGLIALVLPVDTTAFSRKSQ